MGLIIMGSALKPREETLVINKSNITIKISKHKLTEENAIMRCIDEGKKIVILNDEYDNSHGILFISEKGIIQKRKNLELYNTRVSISNNGKYVGIIYENRVMMARSPEDSFVLYNEKGERIWEKERKDDKGILFNSRIGSAMIVASESEIFISNDGNRIYAVEKFDTRNSSPDGLMRYSVYGENGEIIMNGEIEYLYYWQIGMSDENELIISCPGENTGGISTNDLILCYDMNGNKKWDYICKDEHLTPVQNKNHKSLLISKKYIIHSYFNGVILLDRNGNLIKKMHLIGRGFELKLISKNLDNILLAWCFETVNIINLNDLSVFNYQWDGAESPHITDVDLLENRYIVGFVIIYDKSELGLPDKKIEGKTFIYDLKEKEIKYKETITTKNGFWDVNINNNEILIELKNNELFKLEMEK